MIKIMMIFLQFIFLFSFISCSKAPLEDVKTSSIYAEFDAYQNENGNVECIATFKVGGATGTYLDLEEAGRVSCNGVKMQRSELVGIIEYRADVKIENDSKYEFEFERTDDEPGIFTATAVIPEVPVINFPKENDKINKSQNYQLKWISDSHSNAHVGMEVEYLNQGQNEFKNISEYQSPEVGSIILVAKFELPAGQIEATAYVERTQSAVHAEGLKGETKGHSRHEVNFYLVD